jgi:hypothetical protein
MKWMLIALSLAGCAGGEQVAQVLKNLQRKVEGAPRSTTTPRPPSRRFSTVVSRPPSRPSTAPTLAPSLPADQRLVALARELLAFIANAARLGAKADSSEECALYGLAEDEGYCFGDDVTSYVIFCHDGAAWALDCGSFGDRVACDEQQDSVACAEAPETSLAPELVTQPSAATDWLCASQEEGAAECDGDVAVYCQDGLIRELDCATWSDESGHPAGCGVLDREINCGW